jgi:HEAT repeat protein
MIELEDFQPYIQSILDSSPKDGDWGDRYIPTQVELPLRVQTYEPSLDDLEQSQSEKKKHPEQFAVLDGLRKYASEHVLLVGKPGSGKSTALRRLRWEEADRCAKAIEQNQDTIPPIPVLLELRSLGSSVLELLRETLEWSGVDLEEQALKALLREKQLFLLLDGVNELPNDVARQAVGKFRQLCVSASVPLIFTTRELGAGFDLGISRKLEMLPLSELQVREFVQKQLPEQGDVLLRQVQGRLRELAETPLLLKLLCQVFRHNQQQVPRSRGELFRTFARDYDQIRPWDTVAASSGFREFRDELLRELAVVMMQGEQPTELRLQISRDEAERILEKSLADRVEAPGLRAKEWLGDLIEYHFLQVADDPKKIEFHHQLFQEYYAAEWLFLRLVNLSDEVLKYHYLNYLKWTESLAMMMMFIESENQAEYLVKLSFDVDYRLGAQLAGEVKSEFQITTVLSVSSLEIPEYLKVELLGETRSDEALSNLLISLKNKDRVVREKTTIALRKIGSKRAISGLLKALDDQDLEVRRRAVYALGELRSEQVILGLLKALKDEDRVVCRSAIAVLRKINSEQEILSILKGLENKESEIKTIPELLKSLDDQSTKMIKKNSSLDKTNSGLNFHTLIEDLKNEDPEVRGNAATALGNLGLIQAIPELKKARRDKYFPVRMKANTALKKLSNKGEISELSKDLKSKNFQTQISANIRLENLRSEEAILRLLKSLEDEDIIARKRAVYILGKLGSEQTIPGLLKALEDENYVVRKRAVSALGKLGSEQAIFGLLKALEDENYVVRGSAIHFLGKLRSEKAIPGLLKALKDENHIVRRGAAISLGRIESNQAVSGLLKALEDKDYVVRRSVIASLGRLRLEEAIPGFIKALEDENHFVRGSAINALLKINNISASRFLPKLAVLSLSLSGQSAFRAMSTIQSNCKFYNYDIAQSSPPEISTEISKGGDSYNFPSAQKVQIINRIGNYNENHNP